MGLSEPKCLIVAFALARDTKCVGLAVAARAVWRLCQATGLLQRLARGKEGGGGRRVAAGRAGEGRWMHGGDGGLARRWWKVVW